MLTKVILASATWCGPCKAFGPVFENTMKEYDQVKSEHIDIDNNDEFIDKYSIQSVPVTLFLDENDEVIDKLQGNVGRKVLIEKINSLIEQ